MIKLLVVKEIIFSSIFKIQPDLFLNLYYWFKENQRELPWRKNRNPYRVWISEIMLQQTQVDTVKEYYFRWIKRFSSLKNLGEYSDRETRENEILHLWQGLGYYRRALNILKTAEKVTQDFQGRFPKSKKELLTLPGIGPYTAGAILNFGFTSGEIPAMVDGNFIRVISRLFYLSTIQVRKPQVIWKIAENLIAHPANTQPRLYNEAIMEIGALICKPHQPACPECPLQTGCIAWKKGKATHSPYTISKKIIPAHSTSLLIYHPHQQQKKVLLVKGFIKHKKNSLKASSLITHTYLWRFPTVDHHQPYPKTKKLHFKTCQKLFQKNFGIMIKKPYYLFTIRHHYTQYRVHLQVWKGACYKDALKNQNQDIIWKWFSFNELNKTGLSSPDQKIRKFVLDSQTKF